MRARFHPVASLMSWVLLVVLGQGLGGGRLGGAVFLCLAVSAWLAPAHLLRLVKRARILLLTIAILFACSTPGLALFPWLGAVSPTSEGIDLALEHGGRLLLVLGLLALLLQHSAPADLVAGIHGVLRPFAALGVPREKLALRLLLVLQYAEERRGEGSLRSWPEWLEWLECHEALPPQAEIRIAQSPLRWPDLVLLGGTMGATVFFFWN